MKKSNVILELLKILVSFLLGSILWVFIFAFMPGESVDENEPFEGSVVVFGIATGALVLLGTKYNTIQKAYQNTKSTYSNIKIYKDKSDRLLKKANAVSDKYMTYEEKVHTNITNARTQNREIKTATQFQIKLENYPDLKANAYIMELLKQIKECEVSLMNSKVAYNSSVEEYNTLIHSFPEAILRIIFRFKDAEFYDTSEDDEISDEALGI